MFFFTVECSNASRLGVCLLFHGPTGSLALSALFLNVKGQTVAILGPNGAGKSTLLKALGGTLPISAGERREGEGLQLGMFTQDLAQDLPQDAVALELVLDRVRDHDSTVSDEQARSVLVSRGKSELVLGLCELFVGGTCIILAPIDKHTFFFVHYYCSMG